MHGVYQAGHSVSNNNFECNTIKIRQKLHFIEYLVEKFNSENEEGRGIQYPVPRHEECRKYHRIFISSTCSFAIFVHVLKIIKIFL